jgi:hypothetical protein
MPWKRIYVDCGFMNKIECYDGDGEIEVYDDLVPKSGDPSKRDLGTEDCKWRQLWVEDAYICNNANIVGDLIVSGNIIGNIMGNITLDETVNANLCGAVTTDCIEKKPGAHFIEIKDVTRITDTTTANICECDKGALVIDGGLGVGGNISACGNVSAESLYTRKEVCVNFEEFEKGQTDFELEGITISLAPANVAHGPLMIFDSADPGSSDPDLGSPNQNFGGPGSPSNNTNKKSLGKILIISKDGNSTEPCDSADGGIITFEFDRLVDIKEVNFLDVESTSTFVEVFDDNLTSVAKVHTVNAGNNGFQTVAINQTRIRRMVVSILESGAIASFVYTDCLKVPTKSKRENCFGLEYSWRQEAEDQQSTNLTSYQTKDKFFPVNDKNYNGVYKLCYSAEYRSTSAGVDCMARFRRTDGTNVTIAESEVHPGDSDDWISFSGFYFIRLDNEIQPSFDCQIMSVEHGTDVKVRRIRWEFMKVSA